MRAILGFFGFVILAILVIILIARNTGGRDPATLETKVSLASVASTESEFVFTESGPIVAEENFYQIVIKISRDLRTIDVIRGYQGSVVATKSFANNSQAFSDFLNAIDRAGYTAEQNTNLDSEAGVCPAGQRYVFTSDQNGEDFRRWSTSCRERGNFGGTLNTILRLYQDQIPDYTQFIRDTRTATGLEL